MSHQHQINRWLIEPTTKETTYIIVLGIVICGLPISLTILPDGYHVHFKQYSKHSGREANYILWIFLKHTCQIILYSAGIYNAISNSTSDMIPVTISVTSSMNITLTISVTICMHIEAISKSNSIYSHGSTLLPEGRLWEWLCEAVCEHLSSRYIAHVNLSISSHIFSKIVLDWNAYNSSSAVDAVINACNRWLWIGEYLRRSRNTELVQVMWGLCQSDAAYSKGIVFGISQVLGSGLLSSRSPVDHSSEGEDCSTCRWIVTRASSVVRIDITSQCTFSFFSESFSEFSICMRSPVLCAIQVAKHTLGSYHMFFTHIMILPAGNCDGIGDTGQIGCHGAHTASDGRFVYGRITGYFVELPLLKIYRHWHGNWSGLIHSELSQDCPNIAVLMDVNCVLLPIAFHVHAEIKGDTPKIMHPEPLLHVILDWPNEALARNNEEIIDRPNDWSNDYAMILKHE